MKFLFSFVSSLFFLFTFFPQASANESVRINEVFVHPESGSNEWVEFYNPSHIDLNSYWIDDDTDFSDDAGGSAKKQLSSLNDSDYPVFELSSAMFNNSGDFVVLFDAQGTIVNQHQYAQDPGLAISIGRSPDATGDFQLLINATKGSKNSDVLPTATLTPTPSPTSTKTPTPIKTPTPTSVPTSTKVPVPTKVLSLAPTKSVSKLLVIKKISPTPSQKKNATSSASPTKVLAASTSAKERISITSPKKVLVESVQQNNVLKVIPIIIGVILLLACGILIFLKLRNGDGSNNYHNKL